MRSRYSGRVVLAAAAACVMAVTATGCGGSGGGEAKVASAQKSGGSAGATKKSESESEVARYVESQRKVAACMRKEGVDVPDPDARGQIDTSSLAKTDPAVAKAVEKCQPLVLPLPDVIRDAMATQSPEDAEKDRRYAACMQDNGAPDFPDVDEKGFFSDSAWNRTAAAQRAEALCYKRVFGVDLSSQPPAAG